MRHRPYSLRRRVRRSPSRLSPGTSFAPRQCRGDGAPSGAAFFRLPRSLSRTRAPLGAPSQRRYGAGPRFLTGRFALPWLSGVAPLRGPKATTSLGQALRPAVSELLAGDRSVPGRSPGAARARGIRCPTPAGAAPGSIVETSREDPQPSQAMWNIVLLQNLSIPPTCRQELILAGATFSPQRG
jgi:hypothetical protein